MKESRSHVPKNATRVINVVTGETHINCRKCDRFVRQGDLCSARHREDISQELAGKK